MTRTSPALQPGPAIKPSAQQGAQLDPIRRAVIETPKDPIGDRGNEEMAGGRTADQDAVR